MVVKKRFSGFLHTHLDLVLRCVGGAVHSAARGGGGLPGMRGDRPSSGSKWLRLCVGLLHVCAMCTEGFGPLFHPPGSCWPAGSVASTGISLLQSPTHQ